RLETAVQTDALLSKTGVGVLCLGAAPYAGETNVRDVAVAEGVLRIDEGRVLCSTGTWSVAGGAVYEQAGGTNLLLSGGTAIVQPVPLTNASPRVEVRAGSRLRVADAVLNVPGLYLNVAGGEYLQEAGEAVFRFAHGTTNAPNDASPLAPVGIVLNGGSLAFAESPMFSLSNVRSTRTVINGGHLRAGQVNFSKSHRRDERLTHLLELNGGVLGVGFKIVDG
ncbi:MAG: hypothetical protein WCU90_14710, partial [Kiritimatiellia bacterium]